MEGLKSQSPHAVVNAYLLDKERATVLNNLDADEEIEYIARQRGLNGNLFPSVLITTPKQLIIVARSSVLLKSDIEFIKYGEISGIRISHGITMSSLTIKLKNPTKGVKFFTGENSTINGLQTQDADAIFAKVNGIVNGKQSVPQKQVYINGNVTNNTLIVGSKSKDKGWKVTDTPGISDLFRREIIVEEDLAPPPAPMQPVIIEQPLEQPGPEVLPQPVVKPAVTVQMESGYISSSKQDNFMPKAVVPAKPKTLSADDLLIFKKRKKSGGLALLSMLSGKGNDYR